MRKTIAIALLLCGFSMGAQSLNGAMDSIILARADAMGKAFLAKDYPAFLEYSHPTVVRMMGGKEKMLADTSDSFNAFKDEGVTFLNVTFGKPAPILESEGELQTSLTETIEMRVPGGRVMAYARVIALSDDGGKRWYFIDCTEHSLDMMRRLLPSLHPDLVLPEPQQPAFIEDPKTGP